MRRIPQLDGLRALAVGLVVLDHSVGWFPGGGIGVDIFFVLSGFLITSLLVGERRKWGSFSRGRFYVRRILRLYPALVAMLIITPLLLDVNLASLAIAGTYTSNLAMAFWHHDMGIYVHTWSLALEEQFYLLWPLLLPLVLRLPVRRAVGVLLGLAVVSAAVAQWQVSSILQGDGTVGLGVYNPLWQAHGLLIGCALALVPRPVKLPGMRFLPWAGLAACLIISLAASATVDRHWAAMWNLAAELATAFMILGLVGSAAGISRLFALAPAVWIGARSYAIYLWHVPLIAFARVHGGGLPLILAAVASTVVVAAISWRVVETPFLRLKERFSHPPEEAPATVRPQPADAGALALEAARIR